jgi:hypothetical protein
VGYGHAVVEVSILEPDVLVFNEHGRWQQGGGRSMSFSNVFRWTFLTDRVRLEHLRFGPGQPVELFDLIPSGDSSWESSGPHVCRDDCYRGRLHLVGADINFEWTVTGPKKNESIRYVYR